MIFGRFKVELSIAICALILVACNPLPPIPAPTSADGSPIEAPNLASESEEKEAATIASRAATARATGDERQAEMLENEVLTKFPGSLAAVDILIVRARAMVNSGDQAGALDLYRRALFFRPDHPDTDSTRTEYAEVLMSLELFDEAAQLLGALFNSSESLDDKIDVGLRYTNAMREVGRGSDAIYVVLDLLALSDITENQRSKLTSIGTDLIHSELNLEKLSQLWNDVQDIPKWGPFRDLIGFELIARNYHAQKFDLALNIIATETARPNVTYSQRITTISQRISARTTVAKSKVGVLLPLSGRDRVFGRRMRTALQTAFKGSSVELIFEDSKGDPTATSQAFDNLVLKHHVISVIGPFRSRVVPTAVAKADDYGVPTLTLSHADNQVHVSPWVFQMGITPGQQARGLAKIAFETLEYKSFALLHPSTSYGRSFMNAFWDEVIARGGEVRGVEQYAYNATTFKTQASKLVGRHYHYARDDYRQALDELKAQKLPSHRFKSAIEKLEKTIRPLVDFDAIIIPDSVKNIGLIAPALAVEDVIMTLDPKKLERMKKSLGYEDLRPVRLMGGSTWNNPRLARSCGRYCKNSVFVDGFFRQADNAKLSLLDTALRESGERAPTTMPDAVAFDTGSLLNALLLESTTVDRDSLRQALLSHTTEGLTGKFKFLEDGHIDRELFVLTLKDNRVAEWTLEEDASLVNDDSKK